MKSKINQLIKISQDFYRKNKGMISDIVVFGSLMRGKEEPKDIDIIIIFKNKIDKAIEYELRKKLPSNVSAISKTWSNLTKPSFDGREGFLFEGYSLVTKEYISSLYGFSSFGLIKYSTKEMTNVEKTKFYYALNGRNSSEGAIISFDGIRLSDNLIAVPLWKIELAREFFDFWKFDYTYIPTLIPGRLSKKSILVR